MRAYKNGPEGSEPTTRTTLVFPSAPDERERPGAMVVPVPVILRGCAQASTQREGRGMLSVEHRDQGLRARPT